MRLVMAKGKSNRRCFFICNISENLGKQGSNRDHREPRFLSHKIRAKVPQQWLREKATNVAFSYVTSQKILASKGATRPPRA